LDAVTAFFTSRLDSVADEPLTISFFQFGILPFYYGWILKEPTSDSGQ